MLKKPKSAIYGNMRRQGASVSTRKKHYRELQWHANDEESVGKNVENREYKHLKRQYKKD